MLTVIDAVADILVQRLKAIRHAPAGAQEGGPDRLEPSAREQEDPVLGRPTRSRGQGSPDRERQAARQPTQCRGAGRGKKGKLR